MILRVATQAVGSAAECRHLLRTHWLEDRTFSLAIRRDGKPVVVWVRPVPLDLILEERILPPDV